MMPGLNPLIYHIDYNIQLQDQESDNKAMQTKASIGRFDLR